jgi:hypothetical protein
VVFHATSAPVKDPLACRFLSCETPEQLAVLRKYRAADGSGLPLGRVDQIQTQFVRKRYLKVSQRDISNHQGAGFFAGRRHRIPQYRTADTHLATDPVDPATVPALVRNFFMR